MKAKKVLIVYSGAKVWGGIETYLENFFSSYDVQKIDPTLVSLGQWDLAKKITKSGSKVVILPGDRIRFKTISEISELAIMDRADLMVSQGVVANYYARKAAQKTSIPLVTTIHSDIEYDYPDDLIRFAYKISDRLVRKYTKSFIVVSEYLKRELIKSGVKKERIKVIYNGIEPTKVATRRRNKIVTIGSIGRFHHTKGYHNLILACTYLKDLPIKLTIFGDGVEKTALVELVHNNDLSDIVVFPGYANDIGKALEKIDIFVQPSLMEGFGLTVVEAMMAGKPVIVTPVGSLPEIVIDGRNGLVTGDTSPEALATAIKTLIENPALARSLGKAAETEAKAKYSIDRWIRDTEKVFIEAAR
jgi:glycosyltransferase involved in cell wall biosynthesis